MSALDLRAEGARVVPEMALEIRVPASLRARAIDTWRGRMVNEHGSAQVFTQLAAQLDVAGIDPVLVTECARFADEERRHGELCAGVVVAIGGEARAPARPAQTLPAHDDVDRLSAALRNVVHICCFSETIAVALIGAEREEMPDGSLRALLTRIWSDEVGHARFGWRVLASLGDRWTDALRAEISRYLPTVMAQLDAHYEATMPKDARQPDGGAALGLCDGGAGHSLYRATVDQVIAPRLEGYGITLPRRSFAAIA